MATHTATESDLHVSEFTVSARDGFPLAVTKYMPSYVPAGLVIIASATGVAQPYYRRFAEYLAGQRFITLTFDYRGIGKSLRRSIRGFHAQMHEWGEQDLAGIIDYVRLQHHEHRPFLLGHSAGGQMIGMQDHLPEVRGVVTLGTQSGYWGHWSGLGKIGMWGFSNVLVPALTATVGYLPMRALRQGENLPKGVAQEWAGWCRHPDYLFSSGRASLQNYADYRGPVLAITATDDGYAPPAAMSWLADKYVNAKLRKLVLDPKTAGQKIGHFGYFRPRLEAVVWEPVKQFLYTHA